MDGQTAVMKSYSKQAMIAGAVLLRTYAALSAYPALIRQGLYLLYKILSVKTVSMRF